MDQNGCFIRFQKVSFLLMERHFASFFFSALLVLHQSPVARISQVSSNPLRGRKADTSCESSFNKVQPPAESHLLRPKSKRIPGGDRALVCSCSAYRIIDCTFRFSSFHRVSCWSIIDVLLYLSARRSKCCSLVIAWEEGSLSEADAERRVATSLP